MLLSRKNKPRFYQIAETDQMITVHYAQCTSFVNEYVSSTSGNYTRDAARPKTEGLTRYQWSGMSL